MTEYIGDMEIGAFSQMLPTDSGPVSERDYLGIDDPVVVEMDTDLEDLTVRPLLDERLHPTNASITLQRENIYSLQMSEAAENTIDKLDWTGWLQVRNVMVPRDSSYTTGQIVGEFYPYGEFKPGLWINKFTYSNDFEVERAGIYAFPDSVTNTEIWSKTEAADVTSVSSIDTRDGTIDRYTPWSYFNPNDQTAPTFGFREEYGWLREAQLSSQGDSVDTTGISVPSGDYKIKARLSDDDITGDVSLLQGSNTVSTVSTGTSDITVVESDVFGASGTIDISVEKETADSNTIRVDGYWLEPEYRPAAMYDIDLSGDFHAPNNISPVRVFDDEGNSDRSNWQQIHSLEHSFSGDMVIENGILQLEFREGDINLRRGGSYQDFINLGTHALDFQHYSIDELDAQMVRLRAWLSDDDGDLWEADFTLMRGEPAFRVNVLQSNTSGTSYVDLDTTYSHGASVDKIFSENQHSASEPTTNTDCWVAGVGGDHLAVFGSTTTMDELYFNPEIERVGYSISEGDTLFLGGYTFSEGNHLTETSPSGSPGEYQYEAGTDLPHGTYLIGWRIESDGGEDVTITVENDNSDVSIDDKGANWTTATTTNFDYYLRYYETENDGTFVSEVTSGSPGAITVDEVVLLPVTLDGEVGVQDHSHELLTKLVTKPTLQER